MTHMGSDTKKLRQNHDDTKETEKCVTVEQHGASVMESGRDSGGVAHTNQQVVPPSEEMILKEFTFSELQRATRNFGQDMVIGEGGFGRVYKGWLDSDKIAVAIKKSKAESDQGLQEWQAELMYLGKFSHSNLVKLLGYCWVDIDYFLVYEFLPNRSLEDHLFRNGAEPLSWYARINIAIGAAQGLAFLHNTENKIVCRDMRSSKILLDEDFNAKISIYGLAKFGPNNGESHFSTAIASTYGYAAPEYIAKGQFNFKTDVYAFGMVMLEIMTGIRANDGKQHAMKHNLVNWTRPFFLSDKKRVERIMDPELEHDYPAKGARKVIGLITNCVETDPKKRPSMKEVVSVLQGINAIKWKPNRSKTNTRQPRKYCHQNQITQLNPGTVVDTPEEYYLRFPVKNIDDIPDYNEEVGLSIIATVIGFDFDEGWYSFYCRNCSKKVTKNDVDNAVEPFNCDVCGRVSDVYKKTRVVIRVQDETGSSSFILFERHVKDLIHCGKEWLMDKISKDQGRQNIPDEFNTLLNRKFVFKVQISKFNLENKSLAYTVHRLTADESVLDEVFKRSSTYEL
uniref:probable serine/threonine-protein kinase PBL11 n=1 Tax=Erigeron canadensis TaxID=72917 RepID=UPI001CB8B2A3|nr:probable serine/threonine-protein kinase PBL11 [Erigeron canadensis]